MSMVAAVHKLGGDVRPWRRLCTGLAATAHGLGDGGSSGTWEAGHPLPLIAQLIVIIGQLGGRPDNYVS
jgi:hypothetical protein